MISFFRFFSVLSFQLSIALKNSIVASHSLFFEHTTKKKTMMYNQQYFGGQGGGGAAGQGFHSGAYYNAQPQPHPSAAAAALPRMDENLVKVHQWIQQLLVPEQREVAITELTKVREALPDLGPMLWHSTGAIAVLLQEMTSVYPLLSHPAALPLAASNRVSNALALLQLVASHPDTRKAFLEAQMCLYLFPFLTITGVERPYEYLRLTSLGVIGALVKSDEGDVVSYLLGTEIVPLCLKIMETGTELSKTVATFVVQKILLSDQGLNYVCLTPERFTAVATVLRSMVIGQCTPRLLRHIIRCFLRLSEHARARDALKKCLPDQLRDETFSAVIAEDNNMKKWLLDLLINIGDEGAKKLKEQMQAQ